MRKTMLLIVTLVVVAILAAPVIVASKKGGQSGNSNVAHADLRPPPEVWGDLKFNPSGCALDYVFNAHGLEPGVEYKLTFFRLLATGTANGGGNLHLAGSFEMKPNWILTDRPVILRSVLENTLALRSQETYTFTYDCP